MKVDRSNTKAYLVGGGIASLASAIYLIRDAGVSGENIFVLEESAGLGGSLDAKKLSSGDGYVMRGFRMLEEKIYSSMYKLFSDISSLDDPKKSLKDELFVFNKKVKTRAKARLIEDGKVIISKKLGLSMKDRLALLNLLICSDASLEGLRVDEYFSPAFFKSNFYFEFGTTFSFQPWSSMAEFRLYILRFLHDCPVVYTGECIRTTQYNQYESMIVPIVDWLKKQKVNFMPETHVVDLDFLKDENKKTVQAVYYINEGVRKQFNVSKDDFVFVTLGSMTADSSMGFMNTAPEIHSPKDSNAWELWKNLANKYSDLGNPSAFISDTEKSKWVSFTLTNRDSQFFDLMEKLTGNKPGTGGLVTLSSSNWLITLGIPYQPHFANQPDNWTVSWGYGLFPNKKGNFVKKKMDECTGEEILREMLMHLKFDEQMEHIVSHSTCIPVLMPYITSQFLPRKANDRPLVVPKGSTNLALIGQYSELTRGIVFTVENSIRSAQVAVYTLLGVKKKVTPIYKDKHIFKVLYNAVKTALR